MGRIISEGLAKPGSSTFTGGWSLFTVRKSSGLKKSEEASGEPVGDTESPEKLVSSDDADHKASKEGE